VNLSVFVEKEVATIEANEKTSSLSFIYTNDKVQRVVPFRRRPKSPIIIVLKVISIITTCHPLVLHTNQLLSSLLFVSSTLWPTTILPKIPLTLHECCLIGRLLSNKPICFKPMRNTLSSVWKPDRKVEISQMDTNRFMFQSFVPEDIERIFQTGPWLFDSSMLVTSNHAPGQD